MQVHQVEDQCPKVHWQLSLDEENHLSSEEYSSAFVHLTFWLSYLELRGGNNKINHHNKPGDLQTGECTLNTVFPAQSSSELSCDTKLKSISIQYFLSFSPFNTDSRLL